MSVLGDLFGFTSLKDSTGSTLPPTLPPDPTGATVEVSLKRQVDRLQGPHFHLNVFKIGSDLFSNSDKQEINYSIFKLRNIYHQAGIGVGRVLHSGVDSSKAGGLDTPTSKGDLRQITQNWTADNDGIDLFIPFNMNVPAGKKGTASGVLASRGHVQEQGQDNGPVRLDRRAAGRFCTSAPIKRREQSPTSSATIWACGTTTRVRRISCARAGKCPAGNNPHVYRAHRASGQQHQQPLLDRNGLLEHRTRGDDNERSDRRDQLECNIWSSCLI